MGSLHPETLKVFTDTYVFFPKICIRTTQCELHLDPEKSLRHLDGSWLSQV